LFPRHHHRRALSEIGGTTRPIGRKPIRESIEPSHLLPPDRIRFEAAYPGSHAGGSPGVGTVMGGASVSEQKTGPIHIVDRAG